MVIIAMIKKSSNKRMRSLVNLAAILFFTCSQLQGQDSEIDRLINRELKMTFPSIHFKHKSTDYAPMPYSVDSCLKHITLNFSKEMNSLVIWRDSVETEELTHARIKKLKADLREYLPKDKVEIHSMGANQKIPRRTINKTLDKTKINYLLSLNSVLDISKTLIAPIKKKKRKKKSIPRLVWTGWRTGFHWSSKGK
jgi:hypothetical protein